MPTHIWSPRLMPVTLTVTDLSPVDRTVDKMSVYPRIEKVVTFPFHTGVALYTAASAQKALSFADATENSIVTDDGLLMGHGPIYHPSADRVVMAVTAVRFAASDSGDLTQYGVTEEPAAPVGPAGPVAPVAPAEPAGPVGPVGP